MIIKIVRNENGRVHAKLRSEKDLRKMTDILLVPTSEYAGFYFTEKDEGKEFEVEGNILSRGQFKDRLNIKYVVGQR